MQRSLAAMLVLGIMLTGIVGSSHQALADAGTSPTPELLVGLFKATSFTVRTPSDTYLAAPTGERTDVGAGREVSFALLDGKVSWQVKLQGTVEVSGTSDGPLFLRGSHAADGPFLTISSQQGASLSLAGTSFSGDFIVMVSEGKVYLVNVVDIERYVRSVVSSEMPDDWSLEALKAQAVASRSYALYRCGMTREKLAVSGFDDCFASLTPGMVCISCNDQIYRGVTAEDPNAVIATLSTRGTVMAYQGAAVAAYFHSEAAGMTEDARYVWGGGAPYLMPVQEVAHESPYSFWSVSMDQKVLDSQLGTLGSKYTAVIGQEAGVSGRWSKVLVRTEAGEVSLKGNEFRLKTGLRSLLFSSYRVGGGLPTLASLNPEMGVYVTNGRETVEVRPAGVVIQGATETVREPRTLTAVSLPQEGSTTFIFNGQGWGHGVGLSQWGAKAMADQGISSEEILRHYYPGAVIEQWY